MDGLTEPLIEASTNSTWSAVPDALLEMIKWRSGMRAGQGPKLANILINFQMLSGGIFLASDDWFKSLKANLRAVENIWGLEGRLVALRANLRADLNPDFRSKEGESWACHLEIHPWVLQDLGPMGPLHKKEKYYINFSFPISLPFPFICFFSPQFLPQFSRLFLIKGVFVTFCQGDCHQSANHLNWAQITEKKTKIRKIKEKTWIYTIDRGKEIIGEFWKSCPF